MKLAPGSKLGPYEILSLPGVGALIHGVRANSPFVTRKKNMGI